MMFGDKYQTRNQDTSQYFFDKAHDMLKLIKNQPRLNDKGGNLSR